METLISMVCALGMSGGIIGACPNPMTADSVKEYPYVCYSSDKAIRTTSITRMDAYIDNNGNRIRVTYGSKIPCDQEQQVK